MGPPSEDGGEMPRDNPVRGKRKRLQWGRHPRTAESRVGSVVGEQHVYASMGPPSEDGGEAGR